MHRQLEFQHNSGKSAACLPVFQPSVSVTTAWNWSTKRNSQIKQSLIAPGAQPACQSQSDSKRGEFWNLQGILILQFSSLLPCFGKAQNFSSAQRDWRHMGCCFMHPLCAAWTHGCWTIINPFFGMKTMLRRDSSEIFSRILLISPGMYWDVPIGLRQTTKGSVQILDPSRIQPRCLMWTYLTKSTIY